jgi:ABC-2 type transport system ATP-binding protein
MAQGGSVYLDLSVEENVDYFCAMLGLPRREVGRVISTVDLERHRRSLVSKLSGGEQARVSLAIALLGSPPLLLLDEPTVGLDPVLRHDLWTTFRRLASEGASLVITSHVMDEAAHCDRLALLRDGRLVFDGSPAMLLERTAEPGYDAAFIALIEGDAG